MLERPLVRRRLDPAVLTHFGVEPPPYQRALAHVA